LWAASKMVHVLEELDCYKCAIYSTKSGSKSSKTALYYIAGG